jgi:hypothetical protein
MDMYLADERAFQLTPLISLDVARDRVEQKKMGLVVGTVGAIFSQTKPHEVQLISTENRLEPFWYVAASSRTRYDRACTYTVPVGGPEVSSVTMLGQDLTPSAQSKGGRSLTLTAVEHCLQELRAQHTYDGITGAKVDLLKYAHVTKAEIADLNSFAPADLLVVPPQVRASAVMRPVTTEVVRPAQAAQAIHEERIDIEALDLNFRPIYAFEYEWAAKGKRAVIEFDPISGEMWSGGRKWSDQIKGIITSDVLFDITADAVGMFLPGGSIAVKLVKAVVDRGR